MMIDNTFFKMAPEAPRVMRIAGWIVVVVLSILAIASYIVGFFVSFKTLMWWIAAVFAGLAILYAIVFVWLKPIYAYHIFGYQYSEQGIVVREGFIFNQQTKIPLFRIQNIDIDEGFIMRKYRLATLTFSTAGGNTKIKLIKKQQALKVKRLIQGIVVEDEDVTKNADDEQAEIIDENYDKMIDMQSNEKE
ncbi:PH domain-containing protein [Staphylococcus americanisciuri]|uniref:PH domain-containing protein n=1 Tax=Staphylococcus americanisciuri TaxID=2973940 RepID=A0ABT2F3L3_9STAP|nr:PH domain-containing protein [Staphylococcus americanisciuri]MCS4487060.1 PH domain-containing protein [Staphylococcus americanisciuri]